MVHLEGLLLDDVRQGGSGRMKISASVETVRHSFIIFFLLFHSLHFLFHHLPFLFSLSSTAQSPPPFASSLARPYVSIQVSRPTQEVDGDTIVVEQGRQVTVVCSVVSVGREDSIDWIQIVNGRGMAGETGTHRHLNHLIRSIMTFLPPFTCSSQL